MATLKDHQQAMVDLLAPGSGIPASASRLAHAMHDVLIYINGNNVPLSSITGVETVVFRPDATTPGLNDKALSKREKALKTDSPAKWPTPAEQRVKELENTLAQLRKQRVKDKATIKELRDDIGDMASKLHTAEKQLGRGLRGVIEHQEQAGCRKPDTQVCEHELGGECRHGNKTEWVCVKCGAFVEEDL